MAKTPVGVASSNSSEKQTAHVVKAMVWMAGAGLTLSVMNAIMRLMTQQLDSFEAQFIRYAFGLVIIVPILMRGSFAALKPHSIRSQIWRGIVHVAALSLFFLALPHVPLADMTAIMFITPVFILLGAAIFLKERVSLMRWLAALVGFAGVIIVLWPHFSQAGGAGFWSLVMLGATPFFAGSFLITKAMTRHDNNQTLVAWLHICVAALTLPMALFVWQSPTPTQWMLLALCGCLGALAHYCFTRAFSMVDISSLQPVRFLDLIWSSTLGILLFSTKPAATALAGGAIIVVATIWMTRYEAMQRKKAMK